MIDPVINGTEVLNTVIDGVSPVFSPLIGVLKALGIIAIVYILFLIVKGLLSWRDHFRIKNLSKNVEEINKKMDILIDKSIKKENVETEKNIKKGSNKKIKKKK